MSKNRARREHHLQLLLLFTVIAMVGFGFPRLLWATHVGYTLIALLLTQVMGREEHEQILESAGVPRPWTGVGGNALALAPDPP